MAISAVNQFDQHVGARILEFLHSGTPWHRGLWNVGSVLVLDEVLEAAEARQVHTLSDAAFGYLINNANAALGPDPGLGEPERRRVLQSALTNRLNLNDADYHLVAMHRDEGRRSYLRRWADALSHDDHHLKPERTARAITSHLLDAGFSSDFLHRWWKYRLRHQPATMPLADLVSEAADLAQSKPRTFEVMMALESAVAPRAIKPAGWVDATTVSKWLDAQRFTSRDVRQAGGLIMTIDALDAGVAARRAIELLDRFAARAAVSSTDRLKAIAYVWVRGEREPFPINSTQRGVSVRALEREGKVFADGEANLLDAALELLSHLQASSPSAAVAGGWAAIEALLGEYQNHAVAADRLAMLVACSFPRAELTVLSYQLERLGGPLAAGLGTLTTNRDRAALVLRHLPALKDAKQLKPDDLAALARMHMLVAHPQRALADIHEHATAAFRRLYRLRNLVLHWGKTDAVCLRASLRTASPLVGAGIDRIVHAHYVEKLQPLELVARARTAMATIGTTRGPSCVDLLA
jgi:hypothetical protein